jgi:hypothetical protein
VTRVLRFVASFVSVVALAAASVAPCAGWEATPAERHDCCERRHCQHVGELGSEGPSQADADECCGSAERGTADRTDQVRIPAPISPAMTAAGDAARVLVPNATRRRDRPHPPGAIPTHLLFSVLIV